MWYYVYDGKTNGPVGELEITSLLQGGLLTANTLVWREGLDSWVPISSADGLIVNEPRAQNNTTLTDDEVRRARLKKAMERVIARGGKIENLTESSFTAVYGKPISHLLHFIIGLLTLTVWWIIWLILALLGGERRVFVSIDDAGKVNKTGKIHVVIMIVLAIIFIPVLLGMIQYIFSG